MSQSSAGIPSGLLGLRERIDLKKVLDFADGKVEDVFRYFEMRLVLSVGLAFLLALVVRFALTPFDLVLREDAFGFLQKGLSISMGDLSPELNGQIGWSIFLAPFLYFAQDAPVMDQMAVARAVSLTLGALAVIPLALIGRETLNRTGVIILLVVFTFSSTLIATAASTYSEPLFTMFLLSVVFFSLKSRDDARYILLAGLFGGLAYWVRPNGVFMILIMLSAMFIFRFDKPDRGFRYAAYAIGIFFLVAAPFLVQRALAFGSPFFYGENSKFFVDSYSQVWSENIPVPTLFEYLTTHSIIDYVDKFLIGGLVKLLYHYAVRIIPLFLVIPFLYGILKGVTDRRIIFLLTIPLIWLAGLTPAYDIFGNSRHLTPTLPIILVISAFGAAQLFSEARRRSTILVAVLIPFVLLSSFAAIIDRQNLLASPEVDGLEWGRWAAENIEGKLAIVEGGDLIGIGLADVNKNTTSQPKELPTIRPGVFSDLDSAMVWLRENDVTHVLIDDLNIHRRPYLREIMANGRPLPHFVQVYSNYDTDSDWKVRIFEIDWDSYQG